MCREEEAKNCQRADMGWAIIARAWRTKGKQRPREGVKRMTKAEKTEIEKKGQERRETNQSSPQNRERYCPRLRHRRVHRRAARKKKETAAA